MALASEIKEIRLCVHFLEPPVVSPLHSTGVPPINFSKPPQRLERDATSVQQLLKNKNHDASAVKTRIESMTSGVGALDQLVKQVDATNPQMSGRDEADWVKTRQLIQIITALHGNKDRAASEDLVKNRIVVRDYAAGVALRAKLLQGALTRLQRGLV